MKIAEKSSKPFAIAHTYSEAFRMTSLSRTNASFWAFVGVRGRKEEKLCDLQLFTTLGAGVRSSADRAGQTSSLVVTPFAHTWTS